MAVERDMGHISHSVKPMCSGCPCVLAGTDSGHSTHTGAMAGYMHAGEGEVEWCTVYTTNDDTMDVGHRGGCQYLSSLNRELEHLR